MRKKNPVGMDSNKSMVANHTLQTDVFSSYIMQ